MLMIFYEAPVCRRFVLLMLFCFTEVTSSFGQNILCDNDTIFITQRTAYTASTSDFLVVKDVGFKQLEQDVLYYRRLPNGHAIVKPIATRVSQLGIVGIPDKAWKLSPALKRSLPDFSGKSIKKLIISSYDIPALRRFLTQNNIEVDEGLKQAHCVLVKVEHAKQLRIILACEYVTFIDTARSLPVEESLLASHDLSVNAIDFVHHTNAELNGNSLNVSIRERTIDKKDIDLQGRILNSELEDPSTSLHANQMATIIAGGGNSSPDSKGAAWSANVSSASFASAFPDPLQYFYSHNISAQNHSYGYEIENYYGAEARAYDAQANENLALVHVFSSGNKGQEVSSTGTYKDVVGANLSGNMKHAKNILVIGGHYRDFSVDERNSKGPAYDGRLKPEVSAFGPEGTSDASAYATGVVLLLQQAFQQKHAALPESSLVRATLATTADDILAKGIDFSSGYGSMNAKKSVELIRNDQIFSGELNPDQLAQVQFSIDVPEKISQLRVGLAWNDPAAGEAASSALVNDLDLELSHVPSTSSWKPWVLSSFPHPDSLSKPPVRGRDGLNNLEVVSIDNPFSGKYTIAVSANSLLTSQKFSVVYWMDSAQTFEWTFPNASTTGTSNSEITLRWETQFKGEGEIFVSVNGGTFEKVGENSISLSQRFLAWQTPTYPATSVFKMLVDGKEYLSDPFLTSPPHNFHVAYYCDDESMLFWNRREDAARYILYSMGEEFLQEVQTGTDTTFTFNTGEHKFFALAVVHKNKAGKRSLTYDYTQLGVQCYYKSFSALLQDDDALLSVSLSTLQNVVGVSFEKQVGGAFVSIGQADLGEALDISFMDANLAGGFHEYRAGIHLSNGRTVYTEIATVLYADESTFSVFPNPVNSNSEPLQIISDGIELQFELIGMDGKTFLRQDIFGPLFSLSVPYYADGLYVYRFWRKGRVVHSGKLVMIN